MYVLFITTNYNCFDCKKIVGDMRPLIKPFNFSGMLKIGKRTSVTCAVTDGDPPFKFTWLKNGKELSESSSIILRLIDDYTSNLALTNLGPDSNGNYTCRVSNSAGTDQHSDVLLMKSKIYVLNLH